MQFALSWQWDTYYISLCDDPLTCALDHIRLFVKRSMSRWYLSDDILNTVTHLVYCCSLLAKRRSGIRSTIFILLICFLIFCMYLPVYLIIRRTLRIRCYNWKIREWHFLFLIRCEQLPVHGHDILVIPCSSNSLWIMTNSIRRPQILCSKNEIEETDN